MQVLAAVVFRKQTPSDFNHVNSAYITILMPAHNEELVISDSIIAILSQLKDNNKLLVIADNCNDNTVVIAKKLGADVIERNDLDARGKGYALDYGLQHLKKDPPELVLIVDADCIMSKGSISKLIDACKHYQRPVQALYLMGTQQKASLKQKIANFAWLVKNKVRPLGMLKLKLPCQLMGTGMIFSWEDLTKVNLASGHIVEDMKLGVDLARHNKAPVFLPDVLVTSVFPPTEQAVKSQRTRWEHGHLSVIINEVPSLLLEAIKTRNLQILGLAFDLLVPPLAVLSLLCVATLFLSFIFASNTRLLLAILLLGILLLAIMLAWTFFGRQIISFKQLCYAPIYALVKIPLYIKFFLNRQVEWVRSKRD